MVDFHGELVGKYTFSSPGDPLWIFGLKASMSERNVGQSMINFQSLGVTPANGILSNSLDMVKIGRSLIEFSCLGDSVDSKNTWKK